MKLHELRIKSDAFIANIQQNIVDSIQSVDNDLVELNRGQMMGNTDSDSKPLTHAKTGSQFLSKAYAKRHGKTRPDLWVIGTFQRNMFFEIDENKFTWFIDSFWEKTKFLVSNYGEKIFGISTNNQRTAKEITFKAFSKKYQSEVLK